MVPCLSCPSIDTVSNVADRKISQTFKQEGKQLGVLAAGMQQEVDISGS
jgi:hypothetical protein